VYFDIVVRTSLDERTDLDARQVSDSSPSPPPNTQILADKPSSHRTQVPRLPKHSRHTPTHRTLLTRRGAAQPSSHTKIRRQAISTQTFVLRQGGPVLLYSWDCYPPLSQGFLVGRFFSCSGISCRCCSCGCNSHSISKSFPMTDKRTQNDEIRRMEC